MRLNRPNVNLVVDAVAFICAVLLVVTGFLLEYTLPPGSGRLGTEGFGAGPHKSILLLWGLSRHEWGNIHFWIAISLLTVLSFHLVLHWRWIVAMAKGKPKEGSGIRIALGILALISLLALSLAPFLSSTVRMSRAHVLEQRQQSLPRR
jgi:hypothetical protein